MRQWLLTCSLLGLSVPCPAQVLPAEFDHDRIQLAVPAPDATIIKFYTDSGGGWNAITATAAEHLKLPQAGELPGDKETLPLVAFPAFMVKAGVPAPLADAFLQGKLVKTAAPWIEYDGFLGSRWFAGHVWRIDYASRELAAGAQARPLLGSHQIALAFQTDDEGKRVFDFARLVVNVEGRDIDMLLDTGATARLTEESAPVLHAPAGSRIGASFVVKPSSTTGTRSIPIGASSRTATTCWADPHR
jgi:hypothetical protein